MGSSDFLPPAKPMSSFIFGTPQRNFARRKTTQLMKKKDLGTEEQPEQFHGQPSVSTPLKSEMMRRPESNEILRLLQKKAVEAATILPGVPPQK